MKKENNMIPENTVRIFEEIKHFKSESEVSYKIRKHSSAIMFSDAVDLTFDDLKYLAELLDAVIARKEAKHENN